MSPSDPDASPTGPARFRLRPATAADAPVLWRMLGQAAAWRPGSPVPSPAELAADGALARYVAGWPAPGDLGVVADGDAAGPVGAAWCRLLPADRAGYGFVAADVPELSVAVAPGWRGRGVGRALVAAVLDAAWSAGHPAVSLSVEQDNPARQLYRGLGFVLHERQGGAETLRCERPGAVADAGSFRP